MRRESPAPPRRPAPPRPRWSARRRARSRSRYAGARAPAHRSGPRGPRPGRERQPAQAPRDAGEHGAGRGRAGLRRGGDQRRLAAPRHQLGHGRAGGQQPCVAGVHAAEQGFDEPVHDLVAEPGGDQLADRDVLAVGERPARGLVAQPLDAGGRQHPRARDLLHVGRHAHHRTRQGAQRAVGPDRGRGGRGVDHRHPELAGEVDALGPAGEHRLRAEVDLDAPDRPGQQLAAGAGRALEHQDLAARCSQVAGGGQPGDAAADHDGTAAAARA